MSLSEKDLAYLNKFLSEARSRRGLMAFKAITTFSDMPTEDTYSSLSDACTGSLSRQITPWKKLVGTMTGKYLAVAYNGQSPANEGPGGTCGLSYDKISKFKGGSISLAWLEFITDPNGYWRDVVPYIINLENLKEINEQTGFIFRDTHDLPAEATFNFLIASRWPQEQYRRAKVWYELVQEGVDKRIAFIYANWHYAGAVAATPGHTIGFSPPKVWAKLFYAGVPHTSVKTGAMPTGLLPAKVHISQSCYGLVGHLGENKWFNHNQLGNSVTPLENFFLKPGTGVMLTGKKELLSAITEFVNS